MITNIPEASQYFFMPLIQKKNQKIKNVLIGGLNMMNYVGSLISDEDIEGVTGIGNNFCILLAKFDTKKCKSLVAEAEELFDVGARALIESEVTS